jgi:hypothetical protein
MTQYSLNRADVNTLRDGALRVSVVVGRSASMIAFEDLIGYTYNKIGSSHETRYLDFSHAVRRSVGLLGQGQGG